MNRLRRITGTGFFISIVLLLQFFSGIDWNCLNHRLFCDENCHEEHRTELPMPTADAQLDGQFVPLEPLCHATIFFHAHPLPTVPAIHPLELSGPTRSILLFTCRLRC